MNVFINTSSATCYFINHPVSINVLSDFDVLLSIC